MAMNNSIQNNAQVSYLHAILEKCFKDMNYKFVPMDNVLNNNKESIGELNVNLEVERSKLDKLVREVGDSDDGLIKDLNDLKEEIKQLKSEHLVMKT